jgi:heptosyltransferase-2
MNDYRNIFLIRTDRVGDVILTTPAVRAIRQTFPKARVTMMVAAANASLMDGNPDINQLMVDDRWGKHKGMGGFWRLVREVRCQHFDIAVNFIPKKRTNLLCFLAGIPRRVGYLNNKYGFLLSHQILDSRHQGTMHESEYCLQVVKTLGATTDTLMPFLSVKPDDESWAKDVLSHAGYDSSSIMVAVHAGASCPTKRWPVARFADLLKQMRRTYFCHIVLVGGPETIASSRELGKQLGDPVLDMTGKTTLGRLAGLLQECRLLISNDSGPVHMADALGIPVVSIFTRNHPGINPQRWRPLGPQSRVVAPPLQSGIFLAKKYEDLSQIGEGVPSLEAVWEAVNGIWKEDRSLRPKG